MTQKISFYTFGCRTNQAETATLQNDLALALAAFAALLLISITGILIFLVLSLLSHLLLRKWHESALKREN